MKNNYKAFYLLPILFISSSVQSAILTPESEWWMLDPAGTYVDGSTFNNGGEYTPGNSLYASAYSFWENITVEGIQNLTVSPPGSGPVTDTWLVSFNQFGETGLLIQAEITLVQTSQNVWETAVLDLDGDGIPGTAMTEAPYPGFTPNFVFVTAVPVPAAVWLFGSGFIGLMGIAKERGDNF